MGKIKCKRATKRIKNASNVAKGLRCTKGFLKATKRHFKGIIKAGINALDGEMKQLLKMEGYSNSRTKKIMQATRYAHKRALKAT